MCAVGGWPRRTDNQWKQRPAYFRVVLALTCVYFSFIYFIYISLKIKMSSIRYWATCQHSYPEQVDGLTA